MEFIPDEQLKLLIQIQETDSQIIEIVEKQKGLPDILASLRASLDKAQSGLAEAIQDCDNDTKERRRLEGLLQDVEDKIKKLKGRIPEIKTNKEYQALLKEIAAVEQEKSDIEEKIIILLEKIDSLKSIRIDKEHAVKEEEKSFLEEKGKIEVDFNQLSERLKVLESQKAAIGSQIDPKLLSEYNRLISSRKGLAVVSVQNEHCRGCHIRIPPQIFTEIRKNDRIIHCLSCQRVLYWKPEGG
ncbi:MAG: hypothetical protein HZA09_04625 [Nitrospirae bacterium]|nr:hypothetical protein [Nitrospirota bacterium]